MQQDLVDIERDYRDIVLPFLQRHPQLCQYVHQQGSIATHTPLLFPLKIRINWNLSSLLILFIPRREIFVNFELFAKIFGQRPLWKKIFHKKAFCLQ